MGTRNLTKVIDKDNVVRVAQYGQWDGYPSYTGTRILEFITEHNILNKIEINLNKFKFISNEEIDELYSKYGADGYEAFASVYPQFVRDTGCDILRVVAYSSGLSIPLKDDSDFEQDDLFCEGVYTINYYSRTFTSTYNGVTVSVEFDKLPTAEEYMKSFETLLTNA
jgi:hypothetical protein